MPPKNATSAPDINDFMDSRGQTGEMPDIDKFMSGRTAAPSTPPSTPPDNTPPKSLWNRVKDWWYAPPGPEHTVSNQVSEGQLANAPRFATPGGGSTPLSEGISEASSATALPGLIEGIASTPKALGAIPETVGRMGEAASKSYEATKGSIGRTLKNPATNKLRPVPRAIAHVAGGGLGEAVAGPGGAVVGTVAGPSILDALTPSHPDYVPPTPRVPKPAPAPKPGPVGMPTNVPSSFTGGLPAPPADAGPTSFSGNAQMTTSAPPATNAPPIAGAAPSEVAARPTTVPEASSVPGAKGEAWSMQRKVSPALQRAAAAGDPGAIEVMRRLDPTWHPVVIPKGTGFPERGGMMERLQGAAPSAPVAPAGGIPPPSAPPTAADLPGMEAPAPRVPPQPGVFRTIDQPAGFGYGEGGVSVTDAMRAEAEQAAGMKLNDQQVLHVLQQKGMQPGTAGEGALPPEVKARAQAAARIPNEDQVQITKSTGGIRTATVGGRQYTVPPDIADADAKAWALKTHADESIKELNAKDPRRRITDNPTAQAQAQAEIKKF